MILGKDIKEKIRKELSDFTSQYGGKNLKERQKLGAFFTPPELVIKMIEKFENLEGKILDPACGSGQLLLGCIIAGADPKKIYGNELDADILQVCKERLEALGVPSDNLHQGNALDNEAYNFGPDYVYNEEASNKRIAAKEKEAAEKVTLPKTGFGSFLKK